MKIELDHQTAFTIQVACACALLVVVATLIYRYNSIPYEKGYVQKALPNSTQTYWTKE
jgi:hypothetical protein